MLKKMLQKAVMLAGLFLAFGQVSSYATQGLQVSSNTNIVFNSSNGGVPFVFLIRTGESATAILYSTAPLAPGCTVNLEIATNFSNWQIVATTASGMGGFNTPFTVTIPTVNQFTQIRWNILTSTNSQGSQIPATYTIKDNDDTITVLKNSKFQDSVYFNDDSVQVFGAAKFDKYQLQMSSGGSSIALASSTIMLWGGQGANGTADKLLNASYTGIGSSTNFSSYTAILDKEFSLIGSTTTPGLTLGGIVLSGTPTISTQAATNGDVLDFMCMVSSITFQDAATFSQNNTTTALRLGATTRACGIGDMIGFVYLNGFWKERYFTNNITE